MTQLDKRNWFKPKYAKHAHVSQVLAEVLEGAPKAAIALCNYLFRNCIAGQSIEIELFDLPIGQKRSGDYSGKQYAKNTLLSAFNTLSDLGLVKILKKYGKGIYKLTIEHPGGHRPFTDSPGYKRPSKNLRSDQKDKPNDRKVDQTQASNPDSTVASYRVDQRLTNGDESFSKTEVKQPQDQPPLDSPQDLSPSPLNSALTVPELLVTPKTAVEDIQIPPDDNESHSQVESLQIELPIVTPPMEQQISAPVEPEELPVSQLEVQLTTVENSPKTQEPDRWSRSEPPSASQELTPEQKERLSHYFKPLPKRDCPQLSTVDEEIKMDRLDLLQDDEIDLIRKYFKELRACEVDLYCETLQDVINAHPHHLEDAIAATIEASGKEKLRDANQFFMKALKNGWKPRKGFVAKSYVPPAVFKAPLPEEDLPMEERIANYQKLREMTRSGGRRQQQFKTPVSQIERMREYLQSGQAALVNEALRWARSQDLSIIDDSSGNPFDFF